jgi:hypothetical protein
VRSASARGVRGTRADSAAIVSAIATPGTVEAEFRYAIEAGGFLMIQVRRSRMALATALGASLALGSVLPVGATGTLPVPTARLAAATTPAACTPGRSLCPIPIEFARGAFSGQATSTLTAITSQRWFSVEARAGQTMIVLVKGRGPTRGVVYFPNGRRDGQPGGRVFDGPLPLTGTYRIRVTESPMGTAWRGPVTVVVVIY